MAKAQRDRNGRSRAALLEKRAGKRAAFLHRKKIRIVDASEPCPVDYCGAAGSEPCKTKSGADSKRRHKGRAKS